MIPTEGAAVASTPCGPQDAERNKKEALLQLVRANGIGQEDAQNPERITRIEMVLDDYCCMWALQYFVNLKTVCLIQQAIFKIEGLECCEHLQEVLLNENRIKTLEGLHKCQKLKNLYICSNLIEEIGNGLADLQSLEVFWIAENQLTSLWGLGHAPMLRDLNAAKNKISSVVRALDQNLKLTSVNLAANYICNFREVLEFARLPGIQELSFADPDWGENPFCFLVNYQTYTLFHLPGLQVHDRMRVGEEDHQAAELAFGKKRIYYNMRIKLIKRHMTDGLRTARSRSVEGEAALMREYEAVARVLKRMEAWAEARRLNSPESQPPVADPAESQDKGALERQLEDLQTELANTATLLNALSKAAQAESDALTRGLLLELQTGGNIRMEPGSQERDAWVRQITELVNTRFKAADFAMFGISGIQVHRVTRVHNRGLRMHLEELLDRVETDVGDETSHQIDYLFYVPDPERAAADIRLATEEGLRCSTAAGDAARLGGPESDEMQKSRGPDVTSPLIMTNSVSLVEIPRLLRFEGSDVGRVVARAAARAVHHFQAPSPVQGSAALAATAGLAMAPVAAPASALAAREGSGGGVEGFPPSMPMHPPTVLGGMLLVCSAHVCEPRADPHIPTFDGSTVGDVRELWAGEVTNSTGPMESSAPLYRTRADDPTQKVFLVHQPDRVLPEYLVEFDYVFASSLLASWIPERQNDSYHFASLFRDFGFYSNFCTPPAKEGEQAVEGNASSGRLPTMPQFELPELEPIERLDSPLPSTLRRALFTSNEPSLFAGLQVLNLHGRGIQRIDPSALEPMVVLKVLLLSFNSVQSVSCFPRLATISHLDLSFNLVQKVDALSGFPDLRHLDISWNSLLSLDVLSTLIRDVPYVEELKLAGNPMARGPGYRAMALARLTCLRYLDGKQVPPNEVVEAERHHLEEIQLPESTLMERSYASMCGFTLTDGAARRPPPAPLDWDSERNRISVLLSRSLGGGGTGSAHTGGITRGCWRGFVETIDLRNMGLTDLCSLAGLSQVRRMLLCGNQLCSLERLAPCAGLEELSIEENALTTLQGCSVLTNLRRLDAGSNKIADILDLQRLTKLSQLSLEDNYIDSLDTFSMLHSLMELYLSNNLVEELRSILMLKPLPRLIVLDLSGNGLCSVVDYRPYTIFHLRRLKVLDGVPVTTAEQQEADDRFSGKLTMELLEDKLGPAPACYSFRSVDLSSQSLKELGQLLTEDIFPSLRELNLDNNPFNDITHVGPLSKLLVLHMNKTKIDLEHGVLAQDDATGGIGSMCHLQVLEMGSCGITDISHLEKLPLQTLRILHLPGNEITKIEGISHLEQLRELVLDRNKVKQFDEQSLQGLKSLRELRAEDNGLRSLGNLGPLPRLRALHLSSNRIADLCELEKLNNLRRIMVIHLAQNPVARKPHYRAHVLQVVGSVRVIDGKEVTEEERERCEQWAQASDMSKQTGPVYVFTDTQPNNPGVVLVGAGNDALLKQSPPAVTGPDRSPMSQVKDNQNQRLGNISPSIIMMGQNLGDALSSGDARGGDGQRGGEGYSCSGGADIRGGGNARDSGGDTAATSKKSHTSRSTSASRHVGLEYRPAVMPQGSGRQ